MKLGLMLVLLCAAGHTWAQSPVVDRIKGKGAITLG